MSGQRGRMAQEIRAAEMIQDWEAWWRVFNSPLEHGRTSDMADPMAEWTDDESLGWAGDEPSGEATDGWWSGWLARCCVDHHAEQAQQSRDERLAGLRRIADDLEADNARLRAARDEDSP